ncbi:MAG: hypothetical protein MJZ97_06325 [Bacteroidales bacterium]|nr:hypothetical protein [Bacteroidales bacterium]
MNTDTITEVAKAINQTNGLNVWFVLSIIEFLVIIALLIFRKSDKRTDEKSKIKNDVKNEGDINFDNTLMSAFHSKKLYDELKTKCHPDRFVGDDEKMAIANTIFQEITKNKRNFQKLEELKIEAEEKLNVNF